MKISADDIDQLLKRTRKKELRDSGKSWREIGVLAASGYHVGYTKPVKKEKRQEILRHIVLYDDLSDVQDEDWVYGDEWGLAGSNERFNKIYDFLRLLIRNAESKNIPGFDRAINEWAEDIQFLLDDIYYDLK